MSIEAMKQALERMNGVRIFVNSKEKIKQPEGAEWFEEGIKALEEAIAEAEKQEPVAWVCYGVNDTHDIDFNEDDVNGLPIDTMLYTHPQPRTWVGLTDEDKRKLAAEQHGWESLCSAVEDKLKEKNNG